MDEKDSENEKNTLYKKQTQQWIVASRWTQVTNNTIKASSTKSQNGHYVFLIYFFIIIPVGNFFVSSHHQGARPGGVHLFWYTDFFVHLQNIPLLFILQMPSWTNDIDYASWKSPIKHLRAQIHNSPFAFPLFLWNDEKKMQ